MNTLTSVWSSAILGILMLLAWKCHTPETLDSLEKGGLGNNFATLVVLGLMGAYLTLTLQKKSENDS